MNHNIINAKKYKKISRSDKLKKNKKTNKNIKTGKYKKDDNTYVIKNKYSRNVKKQKTNILSTFIKIVALFFIIFSISYISKYISNVENKDILSVFTNRDDSNLESNYNLTVGINNLDSNNNVVINELYKYSERKLLTYDEEYNIEYNVAKDIIKIDDLNYEIYVKDISDINDVIHTIEKLKTNSNVYSNIVSIENIEDGIKLILNEPNPYIVYYLDFNIETSSESIKKENKEVNMFTFDKENVIFNRNKKIDSSILNSIKISNYTDRDLMVENFRNKSIDVFITSSEEDMRLIGRHEYNVKKYRNGESYFIFGNKDSKLFSLNEVRKALAYAIDRNSISKQLSSNFTEVIDIPYIYSSVGYRYDIYGAENVLISNSWSKSGGIYSKRIDKRTVNLELSLLVNIDDKIRISIAENIKEMLQNIGIKINIEKLKDSEILEKIENSEYDLVLANVYMNENPDITYLEKYINVNDNVNEAINKVKESSVEDLSYSINNLKNVISNEIACIGICMKNTNVVYQKYITGFDNLSYMNIFKEIEKLGKIN